MKKMQIQALKIKSFVTDLGGAKQIGGTPLSQGGCETFTNCPTCPCSEAYTICCNTEFAC